MMQKYACKYLVDNFLNDEMRYFKLEGYDPDIAELFLRLTEAGVGESRRVQYLTFEDLKRLDNLIDVGFDPRSISQEDLYRGFLIGSQRRKYDVFAKVTFDALVSRGFAFDENDVIVLDEKKEPVLSKLPELIPGFEE